MRTIGLAVAGLMVLAGALWTLQGLDYIGGSAMSGERTWSIIGPIVAGLGVALGIVLLQNRRT
ncbi:hypothetical protein NPS01_35450 [Nocardioides psychrotolerans]|uniref:Integral membrane protein n=1 Tax=Nocardioides psychrotolerans TaxID=1005945 RepID=A0A1I3PWZ6_9ACTN|nr:hypothetical protein [Nocardioides psychrotolerans]GEP39882.1 hypothetical protein NPS01_35450 [Nocardioides psychrotolerans]SFJ25989.1 hypothetical protein SAMN05216561_12240 [Nocardioides psychrotolerans]